MKILFSSLALAIFAALPSLATAQTAPEVQAFAHPGIFMNEQHLQRIELLETEQANPETRKAYYRQVAAYSKIYPDNNANYKPNAIAHIPVKPHLATPEKTLFNQDMFVAHYNAVRWAKTGKPEYRDVAINIMNAWADTFKSFTTDAVDNKNSQAQLVAAWAIPVWANTAEIIRYHKPTYGKHSNSNHVNRDWTQPEIDKFTRFLHVLHKQVGTGAYRSKNARLRNNNWGTSAALADMSLGVFTDNAKLYQRGLTRMQELLPDLIEPTGEVYELRIRDCYHPQYTLIGFTQAAQIELNQGGSTLRNLARNNRPILLSGIEYMSRAINKGSPARNCTREILRDGYASMALRMYSTENGQRMPELEKAMDKASAKPTSMFANFTDITHGGNMLNGN